MRKQGEKQRNQKQQHRGKLSHNYSAEDDDQELGYPVPSFPQQEMKKQMKMAMKLMLEMINHQMGLVMVMICSCGGTDGGDIEGERLLGHSGGGGDCGGGGE